LHAPDVSPLLAMAVALYVADLELATELVGTTTGIL
jgi:hypothetical protein